MKEFDKKRNELNNLTAPADFEDRLRKKLKTVPNRKKRVSTWLLAAAAALCITLATANYSALAFYGKTLLGYEELMSESIQKLNDEGYGQQIGKELTLKDGTVFTIEGIMSDRNQFELYYAVTGDAELFFESFHFPQIEGFLTTAQADSGTFDLEKNKGRQTFEPVNAFAKELTLSFNYKNERYEVTFPYDANKAIPTTLKKNINQTFTFDYGSVKFEALYATKGSTRLEGVIKEKTNRNIQYNLYEIVLVADGKVLEGLGTGLQSTSGSKYKFEIDYDALPSEMEKLTLEVRQFNGMDNVAQTISPQVGKYTIGSTELEILHVKVEDGQTKIRISSAADILYDEVWVETDTGRIQLAGSEGYDEQRNTKQRTLIFDTTEEIKKLSIGNVYYNKEYGEIISIPLN